MVSISSCFQWWDNFWQGLIWSWLSWIGCIGWGWWWWMWWWLSWTFVGLVLGWKGSVLVLMRWVHRWWFLQEMRLNRCWCLSFCRIQSLWMRIFRLWLIGLRWAPVSGGSRSSCCSRWLWFVSITWFHWKNLFFAILAKKKVSAIVIREHTPVLPYVSI